MTVSSYPSTSPVVRQGSNDKDFRSTLYIPKMCVLATIRVFNLKRLLCNQSKIFDSSLTLWRRVAL